MAAIYSGIPLKLKCPQTPWEDKLKLARFAWISTQCLLPNKEQVLLDWCTHALTGWYNQKVVFSQNVLEGLWFYLDDLLHSTKLHSLVKQGKTITLRLNMAQLLLERLQEFICAHTKSPVGLSTVLSVCQGLLSSPVLSSVFITKYELMVDLLAKLCSVACHKLQQPVLTEPTMAEAAYQENVTTESLQTLHSNLDSSQIEMIIESSSDQLELEAKKSPKSKGNRSANLFDVLLQVLSCYLSVQRQQANSNRVFTMVINHLIQTLVVLRHLLTSGDCATVHTQLDLHQQLCKDIRVKIDTVLQLALFPPEHLNSYKEELLPGKEDSGKRGAGGAKGPLKPVIAIISKLDAQGYCQPSLHYPVKSITLSLLFKFFLESYRKGRGDGEEAHRMLCFYFFTRLALALDVAVDGHCLTSAKADQSVSVTRGQKPPPNLFSPENWCLALLTVESLLSQALSADIYNVAADRIRHEEVQLNFYRALGKMLLNQAQPSIPAWYRCLKVLLTLNHLILEPSLDQLLSSVWINSECMDSRVQRARQLVVCSLFQTYTRLRQLPRLFSELLSVICEPSLDHNRPPLLSDSISASLRTCLLDTPPSQGLEVCTLVLESIKGSILPELVREEMEMEIDGGTHGIGMANELQHREDASLKLFSLCQLLQVVLFSLKTLDHTSSLPIIRQSKCLMEEVQHVVKDLLHLLKNENKTVKTNTNSVPKTPRKGKKKVNLKESESVSESKIGAPWEHKTQEAALLLQYTWVEVDTLFSTHCSKYLPLDSAQTTANKTECCAPSLTNIDNIISGEIFPEHLQASCSPMSSLLLKHLALQQMKKVFLDTPSLLEPTSAAVLSRATKFILAESKFRTSPDREQVWDGQIGSVNAGTYLVSHWYLITSNLPLITPYMNGDDVDFLAGSIVSSVLNMQSGGGKHSLSGLTVSGISSQLLQSPVFAELPSLFSATVRFLTQKIIGVLKAAHVPKVCPLRFQFTETGVGKKSFERDTSQLLNIVDKTTIVEDILTSLKTSEVAVLLSDTQREEIINFVQILTQLNQDGINSEDLSEIFLLLFFTLTSTSSQSDQTAADPPGSGSDVVFLVKLIRILNRLLEGRNFHSVLKHIHGGTLLQAAMSSLLRRSNNVRHQTKCSPDWLDLIKAVQTFISCSVQLIIVRNSSVRLNLDQFGTYLTSKEVTSGQVVAQRSEAVSGKADVGASISSVHLLLASLTTFSQTMSSNLGRSKPMDQTLRQMLIRMTASLGPAVEWILKAQTLSQTGIQPPSILGQAFVVEVVTVMLQCELSTLSVEEENNQKNPKLTHMGLYQSFCQQILKEISSAQRPMDFLLSSLHFLSIFYKAVKKVEGENKQGEETKGGKEIDELYMQMVQRVHRLLTVSWLSSNNVCELEPAVEELLQRLVEKSTTDQFNLMLLTINKHLASGPLVTGNYREVLSAVVLIKLLSCCQLPEPCSKALWLFIPQILSAMVFLMRWSSQDVSLTLPFTIPTVMSMTTLLRQGEGLIANPHHVILAIGGLHFVPLDRLTPSVYQSAFLSVHEALFAIIQCHPQVMLKAAPSFLNVFHRLLTSIMQEGRQRGDGNTGPESDVYLECSRLIERMYSHITTTAESFTTLSAFMVAHYVTELQKVTLRPDIKMHLTEGIYRILDLCMERDIKFLTAGLHMGVREVFNELYSSYTHYHKAQRQGEDKYTV
ncbi:unhealthy ribosome biogenesis protein 2 homolog [Antennarius striatus]|uniref:unhealthy ribosome biogenesis protein 2 homolog n=1 Tax=Antennarius striatus TaxID=241820 RepID=UPI0035B0394B